MKIRKFKNGNIRLRVEKVDFKADGTVYSQVYHDEMFLEDLYINQINGYQYICDQNTGLVYEMGSYMMQNPLRYLLEELELRKKFELKPLSKKQSKSLMQDLENGY